MSFSISFPHVLGASYSQRIPWTVQVPFIVDRKFPVWRILIWPRTI